MERVEELSMLMLEENKSVVLTSHFNPDGDAVGSLVAMYLYLKRRGVRVKAVLPNDMPQFYRWLPGVDELLIFTSDRQGVRGVLAEADVVFSLDYNSPHRLEWMRGAFDESKGVKVLVDHHLDYDSIYDFVFHDTTVSSTAELVYDFIVADGGVDLIDLDIATAIYLGIMTDTGSFSFSCNEPKTYLITAHLISKGVDVKGVHDLVYNTYSENRLRLLGFALSKRLHVVRGRSMAYMVIKLKDQEEFEFQPGDTEGLVNYTLAMEGIKLGVLFSQKEDKVRISLRSKGDFNVNEFARRYFNGGGHRNASGATSVLSLKETVAKFLAAVDDCGEL